MTIRVALLALCLAAGAASRAAPQSAPKAARPGERGVADPSAPTFVGNFTAIPGGLSNAPGHDNAPSVQRAYDALIARLDYAGGGASGTVRIPAGISPWLFRQPVWMDHGNIGIEGEPGARVKGDRDAGVLSPFVLGVRRKGPAGETITPAYRPDVFGVLDASAASGPGQRWGFRTNFDGYMLGQGTSLTHVGGSDCYKSVSTLTIDLAYRIFARTSSNWPFLAGMGNCENSRGNPWMIQVEPGGVFHLSLGTQGAAPAAPTFPYAKFTVPGGDSGLHRVTVQVDLAAGTVTAWADRRQVAVSLYNAPAPGCHFYENQFEPFVSGAPPTPRPNLGVQDNDFALYGLKVSRALLYTPGAVGSAQARADGRAIADGMTYFPHAYSRAQGQADDPAPIGFFPFREHPNATTTAGVGNTRLVGVHQDSDHPGVGGVLLGRVGMVTGGIGPISIRGLGISAEQGFGIAIGQVLGVSIAHVGVSGGMPYGIGNLCYGANYPISIQDCTVDVSQDAAFFFDMAIANLENIHLLNSGRVPLRFVASNVDVRNVTLGHFQGHFEAIVKIIAGAYGGDYRIRNLMADAEGPVASRSVCYAERTAYAPQATLRCEDWYVGSASDGVPLFDLHDAFPGLGAGGPLRLLASNILAGKPSALISVDGPSTVGELRECSSARPRAYVRTSATYGPGVNVTVVDDKPSGPPRHGAFPVAGVSRFTVRQKVDGHYSEWQVIGAGTVNSATPPRFAGMHPVRSGPLAAGGYAYDHSVFSSSILGGSSSGSWIDSGLNGPTRALFGGAAYTPPSSIALDLTTAAGIDRDSGKPPLVSGKGYAGLVVANNPTNFPDASGGVKSLAVAMAFPAPSGDWGRVQGLWAGGLATVQLATPVVVDARTGPISLPATTGFAVVHRPTNIGGYLTTQGWSRLMDSAFGGRALGAPPTWYLGLSTAPANVEGAVAEPSGLGYARTPIPNDAAHWSCPASLVDTKGGVVANARPVALPAPSGSWGTITTLFLADAAEGGQVWAILDLVTPVLPTGGNPPTIAAGAIHISIL